MFIFAPNDRHPETIKNIFYLIEKALFVLEIFKLFQFVIFLSTISRFKKDRWK